MKTRIRELLEAVKTGDISVDEALLEIKKEPFDDIGYAKVDHHRTVRQGMPEVIYGAGKTSDQIIGIIESMKKNAQETILITRLNEEDAVKIGSVYELDYHKDARAGIIGKEVIGLYDVGVAGLHRLLAHLDEIMSASVVIAIAGMEGALASVIGGLVDCPVIAVPTSVGYGASFDGLSALLLMLNSCASGVSVVNIDNGFGAGYLSSMINHMEGKA